jgi:ice-binding like protein
VLLSLKLPVALRTPVRLTSAAALGALFLAGPLAASAQADAAVPPLGTTTAFSVLAGSTITNTGATTIDRSIGVHPGKAITGESLITLGGTAHKGDGVALQAKTDLTAAYVNLAGQGPPTAEPQEIGNQVLTAGVYRTSSSMQLTGVLTLNGDADDVFVFQAPSSTLTTASGASVLLTGGASACNVFWQVGTSATLGTTTRFVGTIMANASITMNQGASIIGRTLARSGAVTLNNNVYSSPDCAGDATVPDAAPSPTPSPTPTTGTGGTNGGTGNGGNGGNGNGNGGSGNGNGGSQISTVPSGSVDTGYAGSATDSGAANRILTGATLTIGFGALALVAVRRRRVM